jgi:hypothetical protein
MHLQFLRTWLLTTTQQKTRTKYHPLSPSIYPDVQIRHSRVTNGSYTHASYTFTVLRMQRNKTAGKGQNIKQISLLGPDPPSVTHGQTNEFH